VRSDQLSLHASGSDSGDDDSLAVAEDSPEDVKSVISQLESEMLAAANSLEFEKAAMLRDQIDYLKTGEKKQTYRRGKKYKQRK
ncbi:MAG: UvrB/UvrC motif-containing protein, partial [Opitutales bacterium]|nr:UvrB/UvrC motif-containing protein [Opitutales bacterium]